jgi:sporulation protein YlmC with PRC-barrel domain
MGRAARHHQVLCHAALLIRKDEPLEITMIRKLLTTSALVALIATGAYAQNAAAPAAPAAAATAAGRSLVTIATGYTLQSSDNLASKLIGQSVYASTASDAPEVGKIKDLVVSQPDTISAAVLGVGGFLGVNEKNVAVDYSALQWNAGNDGNRRAVLNTTKDELLAAPDFVFPDNATPSPAANKNNQANNAANNSAMAPAGNANAANNANANANAAPVAAVDVTALKPVDIASLKSDDLKGTDVIDPRGQKIASINDFVLTPDGKVDAVVVDFGGFLGIGTKQVAVAYQGLKFMTDASNKRYLQINVTKDQLDKAQAYDKNSYTANRAAQRLVITG